MLDWTQIIVACIAALGGGLGASAASKKEAAKQAIINAQHEQKQQDTLDEVKTEIVEVKKRLDDHNGYAEKFAQASKDISLLQKDVGYIKEDVKELKKVPLCKVN